MQICRDAQKCKEGFLLLGSKGGQTSEATQPLNRLAINKEQWTVEDKEGEQDDLEWDFDRELDRLERKDGGMAEATSGSDF